MPIDLRAKIIVSLIHLARTREAVVSATAAVASTIVGVGVCVGVGVFVRVHGIPEILGFRISSAFLPAMVLVCAMTLRPSVHVQV